MSRQPYWRTRQMGSIDSQDMTYKEIGFNGTTYVNNVTQSSALWYGAFKETTDVVTPQYRFLSQRGDIVNHPFFSKEEKRSTNYSGFEHRRNSGSGSTIQYYRSDKYYTVPPAFGSESRPSGIPISSLEMEAGTLARSNLNRVDIESLVEIAEAHKVKDTFVIRLRNFNKYLDHLRRGRHSWATAAGLTAFELSHVIENNWLRYRYGIMPMIYLLEDAIVGEKVRLTRAKALGTARYEVTGTQDYPSSATYYNDVHRVTSVYTVEVHAGILYRPDPHFDHYGVRPNQILNAAWELIPYSFVADWFLNLGTFVRAQTMSVGVKQLASWTVTREVYTRTSSLTSTWKNVSGMTCTKPASGSNSIEVTTTTRTPGTRTGIVLRHESINKIPYDQRMVDLYALTMQNFRRLMTSK